MSDGKYSNVTVDELHELAQNAPRLHFLDVREADEYQEYHAPGSRNVPLSLIMEGRAGDDLRMPKDEAIYLICRSGRRSVTAADLLSHQGYTSLFNVVGGMEAWKSSGLPLARS